MRVRAWSTTISVWTQTSPSGCHSGSCGQPTSASISGKSRSMTPRSSARLQADRRPPGLQQQLLDLAPDPFGRQIVERNRAAQRARLRLELALEARRELHARAARAGCRRRTSRGSTARRIRRVEVGAAVERIEVLAGQRIAGDRVDREVAAPRRLFDRHGRIALDVEAAVAAAGLRLAARQRDVDAADLVDGEALADGVDAPNRASSVAQAHRRGCRRPRGRRPSARARAADRAPSRRR